MPLNTTAKNRETMQSPIKMRIGCLPALTFLIVLFFLQLNTRSAETIPPSPPHHLNDDAHILTPAVAEALNTKLTDFERQTSNQFVVAIYPRMQSDSELADYTTRIFHAWKVGQKDKNNGVVLFIFAQDHKLQIITGYGLEGALPDSTCKQIIDEEITPRFKAGDFDGGVQHGVNAIIAATGGEYHGNGHLANQNHGPSDACIDIALVIILFLVVVGTIAQAYVANRWHPTTLFGRAIYWLAITHRVSGSSYSGSRSSGSSSTSSDSSSSDSDSGSDFSGGGGDTGGGGAGGSW